MWDFRWTEYKCHFCHKVFKLRPQDYIYKDKERIFCSYDHRAKWRNLRKQNKKTELDVHIECEIIEKDFAQWCASLVEQGLYKPKTTRGIIIRNELAKRDIPNNGDPRDLYVKYKKELRKNVWNSQTLKFEALN